MYVPLYHVLTLPKSFANHKTLIKTVSTCHKSITKSHKVAVAEGLRSKERAKRSSERDFMHKSLPATWHKLNSGTVLEKLIQLYKAGRG